MTIALASPSLDLFDSWAATIAEFDGPHIDGAGLEPGFVADRAGCDAFVAKSRLYGDLDAELPAGKVHCDYFWITDDGEVVGFIAFRRELNDWLSSYGGHIGYAVRPSRRREGIARAALNLVLDRARAQGYDRVMLTCDDDNIGSARTIEGAGGVLTGTVEDPDDMASGPITLLRQYWIEL
ncbi:MAG: GNAT family N-acetyltransferase [Microbacterium sp. 69-10]|uniref:GNAT family N-acetyltransferase n=1 Tax=Microbacterium sp. 69-10 TaxID=1895783 RepID=UPI000961BCFC|nr:GNAT family N-acetyltransferase [Microbacterium sp. 69-10]OJU40859.1 MAG: GNAT family N-acetyltransferase [Microbacterium sp. 69-10]